MEKKRSKNDGRPAEVILLRFVGRIRHIEGVTRQTSNEWWNGNEGSAFEPLQLTYTLMVHRRGTVEHLNNFIGRCLCRLPG